VAQHVAEACAHYKHALDAYLPAEYSEVMYTGNNNDSALLKEFHLDPKREPTSPCATTRCCRPSRG
jgi:hypothetical protein